jgi:regulator of replication initiation timing
VQEPVHVSPPAPEPVLAQDETITRFLSRYTIPRDMQSLVKENILLRLENSYLKSRGPDQELVANFYRGVMA